MAPARMAIRPVQRDPSNGRRRGRTTTIAESGSVVGR